MNIELITPNFSSDHLHELLSYRGVTDINRFLSPNYSCLQEPDNLINIKEGASIYLKTLREKTPIMLIVD